MSNVKRKKNVIFVEKPGSLAKARIKGNCINLQKNTELTLLLLVIERRKERNWRVTLSYSITCGIESQKKKSENKSECEKASEDLIFSLTQHRKMHQSLDIFYKKKL